MQTQQPQAASANAGTAPVAPTLRAYTNSTYTKAQAVALMQEHRRLDHIIQGTYGKGSGANFNGCLVGCATAGDHSLFGPAFGIPPLLAGLADGIFESLEPKAAADFAVDFFQQINEGADLSKVYAQWCVWMLTDPVDGMTAINSDPSIKQVAALFERSAAGDEPKPSEWTDADAAAAAYAAYAYAAAAAKQRDALLRLLSSAAGTGTVTNTVPAAGEGAA